MRKKLFLSLLITEESYNIWEQCYNLFDYEIICQLLLILINISNCCYYEIKINLMLSEFLSKTFIKLFMETPELQNFIINNNSIKVNYNDLIYYKFIAEKGIILFSNLISIDKRKNIEQENNKNIYNLREKILEFFLKCVNNSFNKSFYCISLHAIFKCTSAEPKLFDILLKNNFFENNLNLFSKECLDDNTKLNMNRILGNYIAKKDNLTHDFFMQVVNYEINTILSLKNKNSAMKEVIWVLNNIIHDDKAINQYLIDNDKFVNELIHYFRGLYEIKEINDFCEFLQKLIENISYEQYKKILTEGILDISIEIAKKFWEGKNEEFIELFCFFEEIINLGEKYRDKTGKRNLVIEKMEILGMEEIFQQGLENKCEKISQICEYICDNYFNLITEIIE